MRVKFLLTPSRLISGLPKKIPVAGETVDLNDDLAQQLIYRNIAVEVSKPPSKKKKITADAPKPAIAETKDEPPKKESE